MKRALTILCLLMAIPLHHIIASPAYPYPISYKQPDGSTLTITLKGDEHVKWAISEDGYTLLRDKKGYFEYANTDGRGYLVPSGRIARDVAKRTVNDVNFLSSISKGLGYAQKQISMLKSLRSIQTDIQSKSFPTTGQRKLVCILIGFTDVAFTKTKQDFENLFNQIGYTANNATGSVKDYYLEDSYGQFDLTVTVAGPYTAAHDMAYYGANDSDGNDTNPQALVTEAVTLANNDVNFADFDNDNNGKVDGVYVIYAGYGEEAGASADAIWAHAWSIPPITLDGVVVSDYSCSAELSGASGTNITSIGVICHEFGHVLGAPDYYDTDNSSSGGSFTGTGKWDIMAGGSWNNNGITPAHHNAYTKTYIYGWGQPTVLTSTQSVTVLPAETSNNSFYQINTQTPGEFFLMENRQQSGFDGAIPGHGLIIYHVSSSIAPAIQDNTINVGAPQLMYPVCASALVNPSSTPSSYGYINSAGCPFPGSQLKTSFTDATTPSAQSWLKENTNTPITNIQESATTNAITFNVTIDATGVENISHTFGATTFPNPFSSDLTVSAESPIKNITVYDITGKTILNIPVNLENSKNIGTSNFAKGYYLIKVTDANNNVSTIKTVKQ